MKRFIEKVKLTYAYYKSLNQADKITEKADAQQMEDLRIRSDVFAFLTCPGTLECEKKHN